MSKGTGINCPCCNKEILVGDVIDKGFISRANSHDALLDACEKALDFICRSSKTDWDNEITPVLEAAIDLVLEDAMTQAEKEG